MVESVATVDYNRLLEAMGIDVYVLRTRGDAHAASSKNIRTKEAASEAPRLVVACARNLRGDARIAQLLTRLPASLGLTQNAVVWLEADEDGTLPALPAAPAYLALSGVMAHALNVQLSTMRQNTQAIAVSPEPAQIVADAAAKRALWQALKPLVRKLREH